MCAVAARRERDAGCVSSVVYLFDFVVFIEFCAAAGLRYGLTLRVPLGLKGWALGRLRLKRLKTGLGRF